MERAIQLANGAVDCHNMKVLRIEDQVYQVSWTTKNGKEFQVVIYDFLLFEYWVGKICFAVENMLRSNSEASWK